MEIARKHETANRGTVNKILLKRPAELNNVIYTPSPGLLLCARQILPRQACIDSTSFIYIIISNHIFFFAWIGSWTFREIPTLFVIRIYEERQDAVRFWSSTIFFSGALMNQERQTWLQIIFSQALLGVTGGVEGGTKTRKPRNHREPP